MTRAPIMVHFHINGDVGRVSGLRPFLEANRDCPDVAAAVRSSWTRRRDSTGGVCRIGGGAAPTVLLYVAREVRS